MFTSITSPALSDETQKASNLDEHLQWVGKLSSGVRIHRVITLNPNRAVWEGMTDNQWHSSVTSLHNSHTSTTQVLLFINQLIIWSLECHKIMENTQHHFKRWYSPTVLSPKSFIIVKLKKTSKHSRKFGIFCLQDDVNDWSINFLLIN